MIELIQPYQEMATLIFSAVVALSTVIYAVLTALLVLETRQMRRVQTEPKLVAFVEPREEFINFAHLYIQNIGSGPAFDVSFELSAKPDDEGALLLIKDFSESRFLATGVEYPGSSQRIQSRYTAFTDEFDKKIKAIFTVTIRYKSSTNRKYSNSSIVDMSQFEGAGGLGTPHMYSIAESLKKLQDDVNKITSGYRRLKIDSYSHEDREREKKERDEFVKNQIAKSNQSKEKA